MLTTTTTITGSTIVKNTSYIAVFIASATFLGVSPISVAVLTAFCIGDTILGIIKAGMVHGWGSVRSNTLERGIMAKTLLVTVPIVLALTGKGVNIDTAFLAQGTITVMIFAEAYSIIGNIDAIRTGREKREFDAVAFILGKIKNVLKNVILDDKDDQKL